MYNDRTFAFGANCIEDSPCPATAAGRNPDQFPCGRVAEEYDNFAHKRSESVRGKLSEETARECWLEAMKACRERVSAVDNPRTRHRRKKAAHAAEEIAEELGWV